MIKDRIVKAYTLAEEAHKGQKRNVYTYRHRE